MADITFEDIATCYENIGASFSSHLNRLIVNPTVHFNIKAQLKVELINKKNLEWKLIQFFI